MAGVADELEDAAAPLGARVSESSERVVNSIRSEIASLRKRADAIESALKRRDVDELVRLGIRKREAHELKQD